MLFMTFLWWRSPFRTYDASPAIILILIVGLVLWSLFFEKNPEFPPVDQKEND